MKPDSLKKKEGYVANININWVEELKCKCKVKKGNTKRCQN